MHVKRRKNTESILSGSYIFMAVIWSVFLTASLSWNLYSLKKETLSIATAAARANLDKDLNFRKWATMHGGVYVPPTEHTPPNPYLKVPHRDVVTTDGKVLTLMNPAYIMRQMHEDFVDSYGIRSRIISLKPLNPKNMPDEWEKSALEGFERGETERLEINHLGTTKYLRYIRPLITEPGCLKCHGFQGYKVGDIRGGLSSNVPMESFELHGRSRARELALSHFFIWLTGLVGIVLWYQRNRKLTHERLATEKALQESEQRFRSIFSGHAAVMLLIEPDTGQIVECNKAAENFYGYSMAQLCAMNITDLNMLPPGQVAQERQKANLRKQNYFIFPHHLANGSIRTVEVYSSPIEYGDKKILFSIIHDITDRRLAEEKIRRSEAGLNEAQRLTHLGSWDYDIVNNILAWSDEFYRIYEINPQEFGASYEAFLNAVHPDDRAWVDKAYTDSVKNHTPYNIVHRLLMNDNRIKYIHEIGITSYDENGNPLRSIGTGQDITERKLAEEKIRQLNNELEERVKERTTQLQDAMKELESFSYSVSHDLRTPLRAIDGFSQILLEDYTSQLDEEGKRLLNVVRENTIRMSKLINDILHFSRTGRAEMTRLEEDMTEIVQEVLEQYGALIAEKKIQINIHPLPKANCDRTLMRQVYENLISNALKFSAKNEVSYIEVGSETKDQRPVYFVRDNGVGFDMKYSDKLFGVFQRLHGTDEFEGTGIGLAIVKRIITRHGGEIWAEGKVGQGATFYFTLPSGD